MINMRYTGFFCPIVNMLCILADADQQICFSFCIAANTAVQHIRIFSQFKHIAQNGNLSRISERK